MKIQTLATKADIAINQLNENEQKYENKTSKNENVHYEIFNVINIWKSSEDSACFTTEIVLNKIVAFAD
jgi:hypothetical protein